MREGAGRRAFHLRRWWVGIGFGWAHHIGRDIGSLGKYARQRARSRLVLVLVLYLENKVSVGVRRHRSSLTMKDGEMRPGPVREVWLDATHK